MSTQETKTCTPLELFRTHNAFFNLLGILPGQHGQHFAIQLAPGLSGQSIARTFCLTPTWPRTVIRMMPLHDPKHNWVMERAHPATISPGLPGLHLSRTPHGHRPSRCQLPWSNTPWELAGGQPPTTANLSPGQGQSPFACPRHGRHHACPF